MSSSSGYSYSYVDEEAMACRRLRGEIAGYVARSRVLHAQARRAHGARQGALVARLDKPRVGAGSTELSALAASYRDQLEAAERELAGLAAAKWADLLAAPAGTIAPAGSAARLSATEELARSRAAVADDRGTTIAGAHPGAAQIEAADRLIRTDLSRCDVADLESLHRLRADISSAITTRQARVAFGELEIAVADSIRRRRRAEEVAQVRASLLELADDALPEERVGLRAIIEQDPDPGALSAVVAQAAARADLVRARDVVAKAAADALLEIGCEVGEDFATLLTEQNEAVVAFGENWTAGYGLLVKLPPGAGRVLTAVVKRDGVVTDPASDVAVQSQFCADGLPTWTDGLRDQGINLADGQLVLPGTLPVAPIPAGRWPNQAKTAKAAKTPAKRSTSRPAALKERQHGL